MQLSLAGTVVVNDRLLADCGRYIPLGSRVLDDRVDVTFYNRDPEKALQRLKGFIMSDFKGSLKKRDTLHVVFEAPTAAKEKALVPKLQRFVDPKSGRQWLWNEAEDSWHWCPMLDIAK